MLKVDSMTTLRHAKIMPTLGPSSWDEEKIEELVKAGAAAFRLNFSHADAERHRQTAANVRAVAKKLGRHIPILQDLQGPKIRVGAMAEPIMLNVGQSLSLDSDETPGTAARVSLPHPEILKSLQEGDTVSINDGVIRLRITKVYDGTKVDGVVEAAGMLSSRKGVNVPGRELPLKALTKKDLADLEVGKDIGVDWVALSFVQKAADIEEARQLIGNKALIMAKIETQAAVKNLEAIVAVSDGIMIARGDLGVELPAEDVPPLQRRMIGLCRAACKPVVVATQMLESMIQNPVPTRAEASDVATAAYEGADCVMLSAESASGKYPVEAVAVMARIISKVEESASWEAHLDVHAPARVDRAVRDATCMSACQMATKLGAASVVSFTETGDTTLRVARWRPAMPIVCLTPSDRVARQLSLVWGVYPIVVDRVKGTDEMVEASVSNVKKAGLVKAGERIVIAAGVPFGQPGNTNLIRVVDVE